MMTATDNFEAFMRAYQDMVYTTAVRLLGNQTDAEDIAQEVFLKAYERYPALARSPTVGGWLRTVATNLCLNHLSRYRARWRFFSEMHHPADDERNFVADLPAPESAGSGVEEADRRRLLEQALEKLPAAQRVPLVLYHFQEQSYEEIARQLKVSLSKVKTDIHRGREALRRCLRLDAEGDVISVTGAPRPQLP